MALFGCPLLMLHAVRQEYLLCRREEISIAETVASLTPQQFRVFTFLSEGMLNKQIAYEMGVAEGTIKAHVTGILKKFGAYSRGPSDHCGSETGGGRRRDLMDQRLLAGHHLAGDQCPKGSRPDGFS